MKVFQKSRKNPCEIRGKWSKQGSFEDRRGGAWATRGEGTVENTRFFTNENALLASLEKDKHKTPRGAPRLCTKMRLDFLLAQHFRCFLLAIYSDFSQNTLPQKRSKPISWQDRTVFCEDLKNYKDDTKMSSRQNTRVLRV